LHDLSIILLFFFTDPPTPDLYTLSYTTLFRSPSRQRLNIFAPDFLAVAISQHRFKHDSNADRQSRNFPNALFFQRRQRMQKSFVDRKSTRLNSSHLVISYAVFCLKKKKKIKTN